MREKIKRANKEGRVIVGYKSVLKNLDEFEEIIIALNCPVKLKENLKKQAQEKIKEVELTNMELGETLGKPFSISCLGIK